MAFGIGHAHLFYKTFRFFLIELPKDTCFDIPIGHHVPNSEFAILPVYRQSVTIGFTNEVVFVITKLQVVKPRPQGDNRDL